MRNNVFGTKNITSLIYGLVMLLPFFAILGRVIYTQSNPNAKDSYSDYKINETIQVHNASEFIDGQLYQFTYDENKSFDNDWTYYDINYISLTPSQLNITAIQFDSIKKYNLLNPNVMQLRTDTNSLVATINFSYNGIYTFLIQGGISPQLYNKGILTYQRLINGTIDNAFEYSISQFTKDNNLGEVDMFSWFTDLFLDSSNAKNQLYVGFVNWYLNYAMLVSSGYLFFLVLIWFINFVRRILDKSMYQEYGGF